MSQYDILQILLIVGATVALAFVLRWRRRSHAEFVDEFASREICPHLKPALDLLKSRGHHVRRVGQVSREHPLEVHIIPEFDPRALADELDLKSPVHVSPRQALYCKEDFCEIRPAP